jgi:glycosyltransferase involved in cell wall biosynthesis
MLFNSPMRVLYFFPKNLAQSNAGSITRALYILKYFKQRNIDVDFVSLKQDVASDQLVLNMLETKQLAKQVFLLNRKPKRGNLINYISYKIINTLYHWFKYPRNTAIPPFLTVYLKRGFEEILKANTYQYIVISYADCADLIRSKSLTENTKTIIDTHDFLTAQFKQRKSFQLGTTFEDEINRLNWFDEIWAISIEEQYIFRQFCKPPVRLVSMSMDMPVENQQNKEYDLIYVAGNNPHNITAINWFFTHVYSLLPSNLTFCVIGDIVEYIPNSTRIYKVEKAGSLDNYYNKSKIAVCPMQSGTGIKVKVVEALAFGLPVVCNLYGVDGLPNKVNNGCLVSDDPAEFAGNIIKLLQDEQFYYQQSVMAKQLFLESFETSVSFKSLDKSFDYE